MKRFPVLTLVLMIALTLSACGAKPTPPPTLSVVEMQSTAAAVALTMYAQTQAAIPTATLIPPTETATNTPPPTSTLLPLPSPEAPAAPNANSGGGDACVDQVLPEGLQGEKVKIRINNSTKVTVAVSVYLNRTVPPAVCGYRAYTLAAGQSLVISDMVEGCFTIWAWNPDPEEYFIVTNGAASCIDRSYPVAFDISTGDFIQR
jgi:hypothetical protein